MKLYSVYIPKNTQGQSPESGIERLIAIPEGFCWWGFLLGVFWALYNRIWWLVGALVGLSIALNFVMEDGAAQERVSAIVQAGAGLLIGLCGYDWHGEALLRRGYMLVDVIAAKDATEAEFLYVERALGAASLTKLRHAPLAIHYPA